MQAKRALVFHAATDWLRRGFPAVCFYDLFQVYTGFSPCTYLDFLCVEAAIARLSCGRCKIAEVSAELGFSSQSSPAFS